MNANLGGNHKYINSFLIQNYNYYTRKNRMFQVFFVSILQQAMLGVIASFSDVSISYFVSK